MAPHRAFGCSTGCCSKAPLTCGGRHPSRRHHTQQERQRLPPWAMYASGHCAGSWRLGSASTPVRTQKALGAGWGTEREVTSPVSPLKKSRAGEREKSDAFTTASTIAQWVCAVEASGLDERLHGGPKIHRCLAGAMAAALNLPLELPSAAQLRGRTSSPVLQYLSSSLLEHRRRVTAGCPRSQLAPLPRSQQQHKQPLEGRPATRGHCSPEAGCQRDACMPVSRHKVAL
jgi:hypothetical protein